MLYLSLLLYFFYVVPNSFKKYCSFRFQIKMKTRKKSYNLIVHSTRSSCLLLLQLLCYAISKDENYPFMCFLFFSLKDRKIQCSQVEVKERTWNYILYDIPPPTILPSERELYINGRLYSNFFFLFLFFVHFKRTREDESILR